MHDKHHNVVQAHPEACDDALKTFRPSVNSWILSFIKPSEYLCICLSI